MTTQHVELPQALHVALLNCQAANDLRSRTHTAYLDSLVDHASKAAQGRLYQAHHQAEQQADAAFRALGRTMDAEGGHDLWRIVYLKGGRVRSTVQVRPTRESARRREGVARLELRRELEAQGANVQYLVSIPVNLSADVDGWDRTQGMVRLGTRAFQARPSYGAWHVMAYGQAPDIQVVEVVDLGEPAALAVAHLGTPCLAKYADGWDFACTLPQGHDGQHADDVTDAPATVAWGGDASLADQVLAESAYARRLAASGRCPSCQALHGNRHADDCWRQGIVGDFRVLGGSPAWQDRARPSRTPQDGRSFPDLTGWAPGEITEAYGR